MEAKKQLQVAVVGRSNVGKSALFEVNLQGRMKPPRRTETTQEFTRSVPGFGAEKIELKFIDTSGSANFRGHIQAIIDNSDMAMVVIDVSNRESLEDASAFPDMIARSPQPQMPVILVGNQRDKPNRQVSVGEAEQWALDHHMLYLDFSVFADPPAVLLSKLTEAVQKLKL